MATYYYERFSDNEVFSDPLLNVRFNQLFTILINLVNYESVIQKLILDGDLALVLQGEKLSRKLQEITLVTADKTIFQTLVNALPNLPVDDAIQKGTTLLFKLAGRRVLLRLSNVAINTIEVDGITVRSK